MKIKLLIISLFIGLSAYAQHNQKSPQEIYIEQFATLAVEEMYRSGVPASITLAQGLLESRYGLSELAVKGNNHFGIKCHNNWNGKKIYYDDDAKGECFRKYPSPEQSYRDHSDFLRYRDRYKFLFDYNTTDYKSWANGLKKAGYATDPSYASKLIRIIEDYRLYEYDDKPASFAKSDRKSKKESKRVTVKVPDVLPPSPTEIEQAEALTEAQRQDFHFSISREVYKRNGVPFVKAMEGESYASIASANNLFLREILKYNDLAAEAQIAPGTEVYLRPKKGQAVKGLDKHVVEEGETMRSIAQRYGVRLKNLYKINEMADDSIIREGDIIKLRK
jgi:LysM repeat protein